MVLDGMVALLKSQPDFVVSGTSTHPLKALDEIRTTQPDLVITDLEMPGLNGIELTRKIRETHPHMKVLVLSMHHDYGKISQMMEVGVQG